MMMHRQVQIKMLSLSERESQLRHAVGFGTIFTKMPFPVGGSDSYGDKCVDRANVVCCVQACVVGCCPKTLRYSIKLL